MEVNQPFLGPDRPIPRPVDSGHAQRLRTSAAPSHARIVGGCNLKFSRMTAKNLLLDHARRDSGAQHCSGGNIRDTTDKPECRLTRKRGPALPDLWWKRYEVDLEDLDFVGLFRSRGLWSRYLGGDRLAVRCPWAGRHSGVNDTAYIDAAAPGRLHSAAFRCRDAGCRGRGLWDVVQFFGQLAVEAHGRARRDEFVAMTGSVARRLDRVRVELSG